MINLLFSLPEKPFYCHMLRVVGVLPCLRAPTRLNSLMRCTLPAAFVQRRWPSVKVSPPSARSLTWRWQHSRERGGETRMLFISGPFQTGSDLYEISDTFGLCSVIYVLSRQIVRQGTERPLFLFLSTCIKK